MKRLKARLLTLALAAALAVTACKRKSPEPVSRASSEQGEQGESTAGQQESSKPKRLYVNKPRRVGSASDWRLVKANHSYTCAIRGEGSLWCWGANTAGKLGDGSTEDRGAPTRIGSQTGWLGVVGADFLTCGVRKEGEAYCWGAQKGGAVVYPHEATNKSPLAITLRPARLDKKAEAKADNPRGDVLKLDQIVLGEVHTCGLSSAKVYCWGGVAERLGRRDPPSYAPVSETESVVIEIDSSGFEGEARVEEITAGSRHTCARTTDGRVYCWGVNEHGQIGSGSEEEAVRAPEPVGMAGKPGGDFAAVAAGSFHTCGVDRAGAAHCWGSNQSGALGDGSSRDRRRPVAVNVSSLKGSKRFERLSGGLGKTCGVAGDKALYCWGAPFDPKVRLEDGNPSLLPRPVEAPDGSPTWSVAAVSVGSDHTCAVATDGALYCWGSDSRGQCGDPPPEEEAEPAEQGAEPPKPGAEPPEQGAAPR